MLLREARRAAGVSLRELGRLSGIGYTHLSRLERGLRRPSVVVAGLLADALDLDEHQRGQLIAASSSDSGRSRKARR